MHIVLPGSLPDPRDARELASYLPDTAPALTRWLVRGRARVTAVDPAQALCTAYEFWQLQTRGFRARPGQHVSAGLGPMYARCASETAAEPDEPVWLAELVHVAPSRDGAALIPASQLDITPDQSEALLHSARELLAGTPFALHPCQPARWRVALPRDYAPACASPALVSRGMVNDWWSQDISGRPWRRLVNELQMLWFDHPVNQRRARQGLIAVNSLWLFGGARLDQLRAGPVPDDTRIFDALQEPVLRQDWSHWLHTLKQLDADYFSTMDKAPHIVMTGGERIVEIAPHGPSRWFDLLRGSRNNWRKWWSHPY